jgi:hypothetical protein
MPRPNRESKTVRKTPSTEGANGTATEARPDRDVAPRRSGMVRRKLRGCPGPGRRLLWLRGLPAAGRALQAPGGFARPGCPGQGVRPTGGAHLREHSV